jgi:hypothetical protein
MRRFLFKSELQKSLCFWFIAMWGMACLAGKLTEGLTVFAPKDGNVH